MCLFFRKKIADEKVRNELGKVGSGGDISKKILPILRDASIGLLTEIIYAYPLGEDVLRIACAKAELERRREYRSYRNYLAALITLIILICSLVISIIAIYKK